MNNIKLLQAQCQFEIRKIRPPQDIHSAELKIFSQWGEDGIIQWIISIIPDIKPIFIEFGVEDYKESNTLFLLMNNNWKGLVMDASKAYMADLRSRDIYWKYDLTAIDAFIDKDNINDLFAANSFVGDIGLLSIDVDGNDYWIWDAIECVTPQIVICEYNSILGDKEAVVVPYKKDFFRTDAHYSNLYWGASLKAWELLAEKKGYVLIGSNSAGNNAFFVREAYKNLFDVQSIGRAYVSSKYRESRNPRGELTYLSGADRLKAIREMPLLNLTSGQIQSVAEIYHL